MAINYGSMSVPGAELFGGSMLEDQAEEERKKRQREALQNKLLPGASPMAKQLSLMPAATALSTITTGLGRGY